jgi:hypothetical protein
MLTVTDSHTQDGHIEVVKSVSDGLIEQELRALRNYRSVERAVREAHALGCDIDTLSEASGFPPVTVRKMVSKPDSLELEDLAGLR